jgi:lipopolysaccharide assembly outer membrane protein LptD (OstA)
MFRTSKKLMTLSAGLSFLAVASYAQQTRPVAAVQPNQQAQVKAAFDQANIKFSATDSTRMSKDKSEVRLYGNAALHSKRLKLEADEIIYNKNTRKAIARNYKAVNNITGASSRGNYGEFSVKE